MCKNEKLMDWAWGLYSKYLIALEKDLNEFYPDLFKVCLKQAEEMYNVWKGYCY